jgi:hypothetical protein
MISEAIQSSPALEDAVHEFNVALDYDLRLPLWPRDVESAAQIAELRGHPALAAKLREALK